MNLVLGKKELYVGGNKWHLERKNAVELLFDILDLLPLSLEVLLPQTDLIVASTDGQNVSTEAPANAPQNRVKLQCLAGPLARVRSVRGPNAYGLILRGGGNIRLGENARGPRDITNPV